MGRNGLFNEVNKNTQQKSAWCRRLFVLLRQHKQGNCTTNPQENTQFKRYAHQNIRNSRALATKDSQRQRQIWLRRKWTLDTAKQTRNWNQNQWKESHEKLSYWDNNTISSSLRHHTEWVYDITSYPSDKWHTFSRLFYIRPARRTSNIGRNTMRCAHRRCSGVALAFRLPKPIH